MGFTLTWNDLTNRLKPFVKRIPLGNDWRVCCDMVASQMFTAYPWKDTLTNIASGLTSLVDGQQDYSVPTGIYRLTKLSLVCTSVSPEQHRELDVEDDIDVDMLPRAWNTIKAGCLQADQGMIRLECAASVQAGQTYEIRGQFQANPNKVTALTDGFWFRDQYANVAFAGLLYYAYKLADDPRAGGEQVNNRGQSVFTGQLGEYMGALQRMAAADDYGSNETYYPSDSMGADRDSGYYIPRIFG